MRDLPFRKNPRGVDREYLTLVRENGVCVVRASLVSTACMGPVDVCHIRSVGAGGSDFQVFTACRKHHSEQHQIGIQRFQEKYGINLYEEALDNLLKYKLGES